MPISFPTSPSNGDTHVIGSITYQYDSTDDKWTGLGITPSDRLIEGSNSLEIDSNNLTYDQNGSVKLHVNATGLGVNTQTITGGRLIHAHNTGTGSAYFQSTNSNSGEGSNAGALFGISGDNVYAPWSYHDGPLIFANDSREKLRITSDGQLSMLHYNTSDQLELAKVSGFGYDENTYRVLRIGKALGATGGTTYQTLSFNYDPNGNSSGSFSGHGNEILFPNHDTYPTAFMQPKSNNNGYNTCLSFGPTGEVRKPSQPFAIAGTTINNHTPATGDPIQFDYVEINRGGHYDTSTYTFTCPIAGDYMVIFNHARSGWVGDLQLMKNNTQIRRLELREAGVNNSGDADWQAGSYSYIIPCSADDELKWVVGATYSNSNLGGASALLDGYNHVFYDSVTYYLMG